MAKKSAKKTKQNKTKKKTKRKKIFFPDYKKYKKISCKAKGFLPRSFYAYRSL